MKQIRQVSRTGAWSLAVLAVGVSSVFAGRQHNNQEVLGKLGVKKGICVVLGDPRCELALGLAKRSALTLYVQVRKADDRQAACRAVDAAGLYGTRIYVGGGDPMRIHLAENLADAVVAAGDPADVSRAEVLRVLRPGGQALNPRGELYTDSNIGERLAVRNMLDDLRAGGQITGGPPNFNAKDKQAFANQLDRWLTKAGG